MDNTEFPMIDFDPKSHKRKKMLFFKRPKGTPVPKGVKWRCLCASENPLTEVMEQYCPKCGIRLQLQENKEPESKYYTMVVVTHLTQR